MRTPRPASQCLLSRADSHLGAKAWRMLGVGFPPPVRRGGFSGRCGPEPLLPAFSRSGSPPPRRGDEGFLREAHAVGSALPRLDRVCVSFDLQSHLEPLAKRKTGSSILQQCSLCARWHRPSHGRLVGSFVHLKSQGIE